MSGTVELAPGGHLVIRFPYRSDLVELVKSLPVRRFHNADKTWHVPANHAEAVYKLFSRHLFAFGAEVMELIAGTRAAPVATSPTSSDALTISQLNQAVREALRQRFPEAMWVIGEVLDFDKGAGRDHRYFKLIERDATGTQNLGVVDAVLWSREAQQLLPRLAKGDPPFTLRDGLQIRAKVKIDLYPQNGRYQLVVADIDPAFTLGQLALTKERILAELRQRGLEQRNRQLGFPVPSLRIGVLTSMEAEGWNDFLRHLEESGIGFALTVVPVKVQGEELRPTMLAGLRWFAERAADFDVLCIVRGGGSRTDLAWFDDLEVALAVAQHPLKVVVGIGHHRDQSVLDLIAHSEKTPTAVAECLVQMVEAARADLSERARRLESAALARLRAAALRLVQLASRMSSGAELRVVKARSELHRRAAALTAATQRRIDRAQHRLEQQATRLRLLDPMAVLQRGFAIVRTGQAVRPAIGDLAAGATLSVQMRDGQLSATVTDVQKNTS